MRKVSVKSTSKSKTKDIVSAQSTYRPQIIQTQTGSHYRSTHRQSKHFSELHPIEELNLFKKHSKKESGHKRRSSKVSHQSSKHSQSKTKTFAQDFFPTTSNDFDFINMETNGLDGILTSRNRPQLPTNITSQLTSLKTGVAQMNVSILEEQKKTKPSKELKQWDNNKKSINAKEALKLYSHFLSPYERQQILQYQNVYYLGHKIEKRPLIEEMCQFDSQEAQYVYTLNDHINYRYEILRYLGKGSYGQVFKVLDHKTHKQVALKVIKNKKKHTRQAQIQINILNTIKQLDPDGFSGIVRIKDSFVFRKHQCIVFQLLNDNLYQLIKSNNYVGLNLQLIKRFSIQILNSLCFLKQNKILHCDLKPENILLVEPNKARIKIIDFGSSCFSNQIIYEYIQSRYYRAPQITLGIPYTQKIDMWSFACILVELFTGMPLFPGNTEQQQMGFMILTLGMPPQSVLKSAKRKKQFFHQDYSLRSQVKCKKSGGNMGKQLRQVIKDKLFLDFVQKILKWNPEQRMTPKQALEHKWVVDGLPQQIKHLNVIFAEVSNQCRTASKQSNNKKKPLGVQLDERKNRPQLRSVSNRKQNKSIPHRDIKPQPSTARKPNHFNSIFRSRQFSTQK